ncbi:MAG: hypothetical protein Q3Y08_07915 [Butyricicoccus sp.]|nr:hypothetical protein [Butyricicoccus sp.]
MMKRIFVLLALTLLVVLGGCQKNNIEPTSGAYFLEGSDVNDTQNMAPFLTLDNEEKSFIFFYDTLAAGTYTVDDGILTASTQGSQNAYRFEVQDAETLALLLDDGEKAIFRLVETSDADLDAAGS